MEAMAPDEMDQDHGQKSRREEVEDTVQDMIRSKEHEISELREDIKGLRREIKQLRREIKRLRRDLNGVEEEIAIASGTDARDRLETKLSFLQGQINNLHAHISSCDAQISSRDEQIIILLQELSRVRSVQEAPASTETWESVKKLLEDVIMRLVPDSTAKSAVQSVSMSSINTKAVDDVFNMTGLVLVDGSGDRPVPELSISKEWDFDMGQYAMEEDCYEPFFKHMVKYLNTVHAVDIQKDPPFPRGGCCRLLDVHKMKNELELEAELGDRTLKITGNLDAVFVPRKRGAMQYKDSLLGGVEVKHLTAHKEIFKHGAPTVGIAKSGRPSVPGQALMEALAVYAYSDSPEGIFLLTSYDENVVMELKDREICCWTQLNFAQAMHKIAAFLKGEGVQNFLKESELPAKSREKVHISESKRSVRKKLKIEGLGNEEFLEQVDVIRSAAGSKVEMMSDLFQLMESWRYSTTEGCGSAGPLSYFS